MDVKAHADALKSPALTHQGEGYPTRWGGRVPMLVRMTETVRPDMPIFSPHPTAIAIRDRIYPCWVNSYGAVAVILGPANHLGVKPDEFEVVEFHATMPECTKCKGKGTRMRTVTVSRIKKSNEDKINISYIACACPAGRAHLSEFVEKVSKA